MRSRRERMASQEWQRLEWQRGRQWLRSLTLPARVARRSLHSQTFLATVDFFRRPAPSRKDLRRPPGHAARKGRGCVRDRTAGFRGGHHGSAAGLGPPGPRAHLDGRPTLHATGVAPSRSEASSFCFERLIETDGLIGHSQVQACEWLWVCRYGAPLRPDTPCRDGMHRHEVSGHTDFSHERLNRRLHDDGRPAVPSSVSAGCFKHGSEIASWSRILAQGRSGGRTFSLPWLSGLARCAHLLYEFLLTEAMPLCGVAKVIPR